MLIGVIALAALAVGVIAVVTPTVIAGDDGGVHAFEVAVASVPAPAPDRILPPFRGRRGRLFLPGLGAMRNLRGCLERHGLGQPNRNTPPSLDELRNALKACRGTLPRAR